MRGETRARLTIADLMHVVLAVAILGGLAPIYYESLNHAAPHLTTGGGFLWQLFYPVATLVLFGVIWRKAAAGGQ